MEIARGNLAYMDANAATTSTTHVIIYDYNFSELITTKGNVELDKVDDDFLMEEVDEGGFINTSDCAYKYVSIGDTATRWDGTYEFKGWYTNEACSGSSFNFYGAITQDWELYASWVKTSDSTEVAELKDSETKASLYYEYSVEDGDNYSISNVSLRFGGMVKDTNDYFTGFLLDDHVKSYGMAYTTELPSGYDTLTDAMNAKVSISGLRQKQMTCDGTDEKNPKFIENGDDDYYLFNLVIQGIPAAKIDTTVYARAFMILENEDMFYFAESHYSVKSIAQKYIDDEATFATYNTDIQETLKLLSEGKMATYYPDIEA